MNSNQNIVKIKINNMKEERNIVSKLVLPALLFLSFLWLNFYSTIAGMTDVFNVVEIVDTTSFIFSAIIMALVEYLVFELFFYVYRLFIGFSIYSLMLPKYVFIDKFRKWYIIRNLILGLIFNIRIFAPYISLYIGAFEVVFNFLMIFALYFDLKKEHIEPLVGQYVFRTLTIPIILYEAYIILTQVVGVL